MILGITGIPARENGVQEGLAEDGPTTASLPSVERLPSELRAEVAQIAEAGRGPYGHTTTQAIFDRNLTTFEEIYRIGAQHPDVCQILYEIGIRGENGARLDIGTVSSALSRARLKAAATPGGSKTGKNKHSHPRVATAEEGATQIQFSVPAKPEGGTVLPPPPASEPRPATDREISLSKAHETDLDHANPRHREGAESLPPTAPPPIPMARGSPTRGNLANVHDAAILLNQLRNEND
jgi:hypothetical protein